MKDAIKSLILFLLIRGGCILPLVFSLAIHDTHPKANAYWLETISISAVLIGMVIWLLYDRRRKDRDYDQAKNEAQKLNIGDRLQWQRDLGTIIDKGRHYVDVKWERGKHYPSRLNRVWFDENN